MAINKRVDTAQEVRVESPFPDYALPRAWAWIQSFRNRVSDDFSPKTLEEFVEYWEAKRETQQTWGVWRGEELGGLISWEPYGAPGIGVGHAMFKREFWGSKTTRRAMEMVCTELFTSGTRKIMGFPFASNHAIIALYKSIGARKEGVLRGQTMQGGKPVDMVALGLMKDDFEKSMKEGS